LILLPILTSNPRVAGSSLRTWSVQVKHHHPIR